MNCDLNLAALGDVHIGNNRNTTAEIVQNLKRAFPDDETTGSLDLIFITGDFFDRLLYLPEPDTVEIRQWITLFLKMCARRDIVVRVLEGTPSHDWGQAHLFATINKNAEIDADVRYIDTLSIEYIERFAIHVLYVPDEWRPETDDTWKEVRALLKDHALKKVDFSVMHGAFPHQLPANIQAPMHDPDRYHSITKHYIFIGHIHHHTIEGRIIAQGSFDRLAHGEEEPKGHVRVQVKKSGDSEITFVENKNAKVFRTIDCTDLTMDKAWKKIENNVAQTEGAYLRIKCKHTDPAAAALGDIRNRYPYFVWEYKRNDSKKPDTDLLTDLRARYESKEITQNNITELLMARVQKRTNDPQTLRLCEDLLQGVL